MKQIIKGLAVLLIAVPTVGAASILAFGVWTAFMIMLVMIQSIRWRRNPELDQPGSPNLVLKTLREFHENSNLALRNLEQIQGNSIQPPILLQPLPTVEHETPPNVRGAVSLRHGRTGASGQGAGKKERIRDDSPY